MIRRKVLICRRRGPILRTQAVPVYRPPKARKERIVELPEDIEAPTKENDPETNWDTSPKACRRRLEATLVMARGPLTSRKLAQLAILEDGTQARTIILALNEHYDRVGRAFHIKRVAGGYQMLTRPQFSNWNSGLPSADYPSRHRGDSGSQLRGDVAPAFGAGISKNCRPKPRTW